MTQTIDMTPPIVDREFAEKFLWAVDRPFEFSVYQMIHEWWAIAPQSALDAYATQLQAMAGATEFLPDRYLPPPLSLADMADCAPGTLGEAYHSFIVDNSLEANLSVNYQKFHAKQAKDGKLDRLPEDMNYISVRLSQIHDFAHVIAGYPPSPQGEIKMAAFHYAQLRYPYHSMRIAVTTAHVAFVKPEFMEAVMDAISIGWTMGRLANNLHFIRWEDELNTPLDEIRDTFGINRSIDHIFEPA